MTGLEFLGMAMLLVMLAAIFIGLPISFTLLFLALIFGYFGLGVRVFDLAYLQTFGLMKQDEFVAVPMFILMGYVCDQAGLMERLFKAFRDLFAPLRGALYVVVIVTATLFGIAAGTVGATVALIGIMAGPMMIRAGYDVRMSAGAIAAGGTLGILIPPSVMLVVMAPVLDISIIDLYAAAFGPGFLLSGMYIVYTLARSYWNPKLGPPVPMDERPESMKVVLWECVVGLLPVTILTIMTLGVILAGLTTASEAAALGALGAILLVIAYGTLHLERAARRLLQHARDHQHGAVPRGRVQRFRRRVRLARHRDLDHQHAAGGAVARLGHDDAAAHRHLPARLAVRMAGDRADLPAAARARRQGSRLRHGVVRLHRRRGAADRVPLSAGRDVGLLPQAGGQGVEPAPDLSRHGGLHGHPGHLRGAGACLPADRHVVSELARRAPQSRTVRAGGAPTTSERARRQGHQGLALKKMGPRRLECCGSLEIHAGSLAPFSLAGQSACSCAPAASRRPSTRP